MHDFTRFCVTAIYKLLKIKGFRFYSWHVFGTVPADSCCCESAPYFQETAEICSENVFLEQEITALIA